MINHRFAASVSLVSLSLVLAACGGGGGVASTPAPAPAPAPTPAPAPAPTPTPSPAPTPTPTPAPAPTPTPTPAPTPTPTPAPAPTPTPTPAPTLNDDLLSPLSSESFANAATRLSATYSQYAVSSESEATTATISYDQADDSYTLTTPTGSITFGVDDVDDDLSTGSTIVYKKTDGDTTDSLTLTRAGTDGALTYKYVGGAFWNKVLQSGGKPSEETFDSIVYGVPTAEDAVPRSGSATYALDVIGGYAHPGGLTQLSGKASAWVDFADSSIVILGELVMVPGYPGDSFRADAQLSSTSGEFTGTFTFYDTGNFDGTLTGSLFGPNAEEFGANFVADSDGPNSGSVSGALLGRRDTSAPNTQFDDTAAGLASSQVFDSQARGLRFNFDGEIGSNAELGDFSGASLDEEGMRISFDARSNSYMLVGAQATEVYDEDTGLFGIDSFSGDDYWEKDGLKYVRKGEWRHFDDADDPAYTFTSHVYGFETLADNVPVTGEAGYALNYDGYAADNDYANVIVLAGTGVFQIDFATGAVELTGGHEWEEMTLGNALPDNEGWGKISGSGTLASSANEFDGSISVSGFGDYAGTFGGSFFGPEAEEVGGVFSAEDGDDKLVGAFTGGAFPTLAQLDAATGLGGTRADFPFDDRVKVTYDPASGLYEIPFRSASGTTEHVGVDASDIDAARSDASRTYYERNEVGGATGFIFNTGSGNPELQLTYSSFAAFQQIVAGGTSGQLDPVEYFNFGLVTPAAALPKGGTATYSGIVYGNADVPGLSYVGEISGTSSLEVDFGNSSLDATLNLVAKDGSDTAIGSFSAPAQIGSNGFSGQLLDGNFFGPNAEEFGAVFNISDSGPAGKMTASGVTVGKRD